VAWINDLLARKHDARPRTQTNFDNFENLVFSNARLKTDLRIFGFIEKRGVGYA
jgi:hypothetical protein